MRYNTILFDLDGTLTDPFEGITRCVQHALACQRIDVADRASLACYIGPPLKGAFMTFHGLDSEQAEQAVADYRQRFAATGMYENRLYDGIHAALEMLSATGRRLFVATSKPWVFAREIVRHFELDRYFCQVYGSELDGKRAEKHALIAHILREEDIHPRHAIMIGDRRFDIEGARHNGVAAAAVAYGYGSREELAEAAPDIVFDTPQALHRFFDRRRTPRNAPDTSAMDNARGDVLG